MKVKTKKPKVNPLLCWDVVMEQGVLERLRRDFSPLYELQTQFHWNVVLEDLLLRPFEAVVVTEVDQSMRW